jgi:hypothetical protein
VTVAVIAQSERDPARIVSTVRQLCNGRSNAVGTFTLTPSAATTTVPAPNCAAGSSVLFFPTTASAATELGNGTIYVSMVSNGSFIVTHANSAVADRTYAYAALG